VSATQGKTAHARGRSLPRATYTTPHIGATSPNNNARPWH